MPDLDQIKQGEQGARDRGGRFAKGRSGNPPAGRAAAASGITCARRTGKASTAAASCRDRCLLRQSPFKKSARYR
jgi:hypothetical protein